ncbi:MAG: response regulator transcription factor [bacterium]|nr:response regulator transcription factor [bacterium]
MRTKTKIFIVDDHPIVCDGLKQLLEREDDMEVCGVAENANEAISAIKKKDPDLVVADISLKGGISGIELTKGIKNRYPSVPVLVLSMHDEALYAERAIRAGARGYIMKHEMTGIIVKAIRQIIEGKIFLSEKMTSRFLDGLMYNQANKIGATIETLTDRELEVFQLVGHGHSTREIARKLNLSVKTIDTYRLRIKTKLNLKSSTELVKLAIEWMHEN